jgi:hypothetical protein
MVYSESLGYYYKIEMENHDIINFNFEETLKSFIKIKFTFLGFNFKTNYH